MSEDLVDINLLPDFLKNIENDKIRDITNLITVENTVGTNDKDYSSILTIQKDVTNGSLLNKDFKFKVTISGNYEYINQSGEVEHINGKKEFNDLIVKGGEKVSLDTVKWYGEAPTYLVEEIDNKYSENLGNRTWSGTFVNNEKKEIVVIATNGPEDASGSISIEKTVIGGIV